MSEPAAAPHPFGLVAAQRLEATTIRSDFIVPSSAPPQLQASCPPGARRDAEKTLDLDRAPRLECTAGRQD